MNKYFKNFILCGDADYHCLLCQENFQGLANVDKHIRWEKHRQNLKVQTYCSKYKKEFIYKIDGYYYCEACNRIMRSTFEVTSHIIDEKHKVNIKTPIPDTVIDNTVCRYDSGYVIISNVIVSDLQWNCISLKECMLCRQSIVPSIIKNHIYSTPHVINLIHSRIYKNEDSYYRKINDDIFYCFTCKNNVLYRMFDGHWTDEKHLMSKNSVIGKVTMSSLVDEQEKKKELGKRLLETQRAHFDFNNASGTAACKDCKIIVKLEFKTMLDHHKSHGGSSSSKSDEKKDEGVHHSSEDEEEVEETVYSEVQDHGKRRSELKKYGLEHFIRLNPGGSRGFCSLCHSIMSASIRVFKEHVKGACHKGHLELKGLRRTKEHKVPKTKPVPIVAYFEIIFYSKSLRVVWINKEICIDVPGFLLIALQKKSFPHLKAKCFVCDVFYPPGEDVKHYQTEEHKKRFLAAKVIEKPGELIREIRPDVYHCAVCKKVIPFWDVMEQHLNSLTHIERKKSSRSIQGLLIQAYKDDILIKSSKNPDVLYIQLLNLGG